MPHTIERYHDISTGHRVHGHESKCAHLHGHNYRVHFVCAPVPAPPEPAKLESLPARAGGRYTGVLDKLGRVIDFSAVKEKLCMWLEDNWDHKFLVWELDPLANTLKSLDKIGVVMLPFNPTAENMAAYLVDVIAPKQLAGTGVTCISVRIDETRKCSATYIKEDV